VTFCPDASCVDVTGRDHTSKTSWPVIAFCTCKSRVYDPPESLTPVGPFAAPSCVQ
jgi:hypothetical protein